MVDTPDPATPTTPAAPVEAPAAPTPTVGSILYPAGEATTPAAGADTTPAAGGSDTVTGSEGTDTQSGTDSTTGESTEPSGSDTITTASYDALTFGENVTVDPTLSTDFKTILADAKIPPATAQKLADLFPKAMAAQLQTQLSAFQSQQDAWQREVLATPEFNTTAAREKSLAAIGRMLDEFGSPEVRQLMDSTGAGNNPHLVKMLYSISQALGEGEPTRTGQPKGGDKKGKTIGQILYPNTQQ